MEAAFFLRGKKCGKVLEGLQKFGEIQVDDP
jgi:hypothetical protein